MHFDACALAGMAEEDFWISPLWVVLNRIKGYAEKEKREWQRFSWLAYYSLSPYSKKGASISPQKLAPWAWEVKRQKPLSLEEQKRRFAKVDEYFRKKAKQDG